MKFSRFFKSFTFAHFFHENGKKKLLEFVKPQIPKKRIWTKKRSIDFFLMLTNVKNNVY